MTGILLVAMQTASLAGGQGRDTAGTSAASAAAGTAPFQAGEKLEYQIGWSNFLTAASATLLVLEKGAFEGRPAWHFRARATTVGMVRALYELDDQYDSRSEATSLESFYYEQFQRHQKRNEHKTVRMGPQRPGGHVGKPSEQVPPGTRDPVGAFYALRAQEWTTPREIRSRVYDGKTLYEIRARRVVPEELARVPAGNFRATKIEVRVYEGGKERSDSRFWVWLAQDERRTPVLIEALLPFGKLRVELKGKQ
jgi:hypothetical protein